MKHIESDKLGDKSDKCLFMEYPKGYNLYHSSEQNCLFQSKQLFQRNSFSYRKQWEYKLELDEVQDPQIEVDEPIKLTTVELTDVKIMKSGFHIVRDMPYNYSDKL